MVVALARTFVLRTRSLPLLGDLYQCAYRDVTEILRYAFGSATRDVAMLTRVDARRHGYEPGMSDIDLSVLHPPWDSARTAAFLARFWRRYYLLKRFIPILGEVEIMDTEEFEHYWRLGRGPTAQGKDYRVSFDRLPSSDATLQGTLGRLASDYPRRDELARMRDCLFRLLLHLLPSFYRYQHHPSYVGRTALHHSLKKLQKRLTLDSPDPEIPSGTELRHLHAVLLRVGKCCSRLPVAKPAAAIDVCGLAGPVRHVLETKARTLLPHARELENVGASVAIGPADAQSRNLSVLVAFPDALPFDDFERLSALCCTLERRIASVGVPKGPLDALFPSFAFPVLLPQSAVGTWLRVFPFEGALLADASVSLGAPVRLAWQTVGPTHCMCALRSAHNALLSLKNNWRTATTPEARRALYGRVARRLDFYLASARAQGAWIDLNAGEERVFASAAEGIEHARLRLGELRELVST